MTASNSTVVPAGMVEVVVDVAVGVVVEEVVEVEGVLGSSTPVDGSAGGGT
jgi:hypothetical protein